MKNCLTVANMPFDKAMELIPQFSIVEIRMDLLDFSMIEYKEIFSLETEMIATCRESEKYDDRIELLEKAIDFGANYIDIEYDMNQKKRDSLLLKVKENNTKVIISHHNFKSSDADIWEKIIQDSQKIGADFVKLAVKIDNKTEAISLINMYSEYNNIIAFGLGTWAQFTRISSFYLGSPWVYVYNDEAIADGQLKHDWQEKL